MNPRNCITALAILSLLVATPAAQGQSLGKDFGAPSIPLNGTTTLTFTVGAMGFTLNNFGFSDPLQAGLEAVGVVSNACNGTPTINAGLISYSGGSLAAASVSCTVVFTVKGTSPGLKINVVQGNGDLLNRSDSDSIEVVAPQFSKFFDGPVLPGTFWPSIPLNGVTNLTFNVVNNTGTGLTDVGWSDSLPTGFTIVAPAPPATACGTGTVTAPVGGNVITVTGGTVADGGSCSLVVNVKGTIASPLGPPATPHNNLAQGTGDLAGLTAPASVHVVEPTFTKSFSPNVIQLNAAAPQGTSTMTFTITNNTGSNLTAVGFNDPMPAGLQVVGTPSVAGAPGACTLPFAGLPNAVNVTGGSIPNGTTCTLTATVKGVPVGGGNVEGKNNIVQGTGDLAGLNRLATITVKAPAFTKTVSTSPIYQGTNTTFTITINNNTGFPFAHLGFTDTMPAGLTLVSVNNGCPGTLTQGVNQFSIGDFQLLDDEQCSVSFVATGTTLGLKTNTANGTGDLVDLTASASVTVVTAPQFSKTFGAVGVPINGLTTMTLTVLNQTGAAMPNFGFTDTFPAGLVYDSPVSNSCTGILTPVVGPPSTLALTGASLADGASCSIVVNVQGTTVGAKVNQANGTGNLLGFNPAANLSVNQPQFEKIFDPPVVERNVETLLKFVITNNTGVNLGDIGFIDNFPAGLTLASLMPASNDCGVAPFLDNAAPNIVAGGITLANGASCTIAVRVISTVITVLSNTAEGQDTLINVNPTAQLTVTPRTLFSKAFAVPSIALNHTTTMTISITNETGVTKSALNFTDLMPAGLAVTGVPSSTCGGVFAGMPGSLNFSGGTLNDLQTCTITATVMGTTAGTKMNTANGTVDLAGKVASANLNVVAPQFSKSFVPATVVQNATSVVTFVITNTTPVTLTNIGFSDTLPAGLTLGTLASNTCNVAPILSPLAPHIVLAGATLAPAASCTIGVNVTATVTGPQVNTANGEGDLLTLNPTATLNVTPPGQVNFSKVFNPASINVGGTSDLTFTVTNQSGAALTAMHFSDTLPFDLRVETLVSNTCGGTLSAVPNSNLISLSGATNLASASSCNITVRVRAFNAGVKNNVAVGSDDLAGKNAPATLTVIDNRFSKKFLPSSVTIGSVQQVKLSWSFTNSNVAGPALIGGFTDALPSAAGNPALQITVDTPPNVTTSGCGAGAFVPALAGGETAITFANASVAPQTTCTVTIDVNVPVAAIAHFHNVAVGTGYIGGYNAEADFDVAPPAINPYQLRYFSNLDRGESFINLSNSGASSTVSLFDQNGNLCVNAYTFSPDEQLISCCSCLVTPNGLAHLSVYADLVSNALTVSQPTSVVVKLLATAPNGTCNPGRVTASDLRSGLLAWGNTLHALPALPATPPTTFGRTETPFHAAPLSSAELQRMTSMCAFIQANGSGYGLCKSCQLGGLGAARK